MLFRSSGDKIVTESVSNVRSFNGGPIKACDILFSEIRKEEIVLARLQGYWEPILSACLLFIPAAALFTLPFMICQYRRHGSIPVIRVLVVYSFLLYMMCAFLLTVLPLPDRNAVAAMKPKSIQWIPFETYRTAFSKAGFSLKNPASLLRAEAWRSLLRSDNLFEILANIVMQIPLGVYLRYYFRRSQKQVFCIGLLVSLFYELTQLSGLFFLYPKAYRLCSVDDLMDNTLGAMIGYWLAPALCHFLPSRERMDEIAVEHARKITIIRRVTSAAIDWLVYFLLLSVLLLAVPNDSGLAVRLMALSYPLYVASVFVFGQKVFHGQTVGKALLRISVRDRKTEGTPKLRQLLIRYLLIYGFLPVLLTAAAGFGLAGLTMIFFSDTAILRIAGILLCFALFVLGASLLAGILHRHHELPHSYRSGTFIMAVPKETVLYPSTAAENDEPAFSKNQVKETA